MPPLGIIRAIIATASAAPFIISAISERFGTLLAMQKLAFFTHKQQQ
jgi:hypothetical protein